MSEQPDRMDLHEFRNSRRRKTDNLLKEDHRDLKRFFALDSAAYRDLTAQGGLDEKTKELLGLVASTVLRCNDCIAYHCDRCVEVGWKKAELLDALNVALVVGGSITIPHIRTVWEVVEQLYAEQAEKVEAPKRAAALDHAAHDVATGTQQRIPSTAVLTAGQPAATNGAAKATAAAGTKGMKGKAGIDATPAGKSVAVAKPVAPAKDAGATQPGPAKAAKPVGRGKPA